MRREQWLCHTYDLVNRPYEIGILLLCHTDEMLSSTYEMIIDLMSYRGDSKSYVWGGPSTLPYQSPARPKIILDFDAFIKE